MQWSALTEGKQKNQLAQTEFLFIKTITTIRAAAITGSPSRPHQRRAAAKDGTFQGGHRERRGAMQWSAFTEGKQKN